MSEKIKEYGKTVRTTVLALLTGFLVLNSTTPIEMAVLSAVSLYTGWLLFGLLEKKYNHLCFLLEVLDEKLILILKEN